MGTVFAILFVVLTWILTVYIGVLWVRFILDWVRVFNPRLRPRGVLLLLFEIVYTLTDPPIKFFRRVLPPIRLGQVALDLGWMLTMIVCWILLALIPG